MKKLFKSRTLLGAIASIALCISLIAGATFAIFTSEAKVNIAVTSGKVRVTATLEDVKLYSLENIDMSTLTGTEIDRTSAGKFINGGEATLDGNALVLDRLTPGDKVVFNINVANDSNVAIKYRTLLSVKDDGLFEALKVSVGDKTSGAASDWTESAAAGTLSTEQCEIELPVSAGNQYQDKSCKIVFGVEAVQGNVDVNTVANGEVYNEKQLRYALYGAPTDGTKKVITLKSDITLEMMYAAENFDNVIVADNAEGDTFNHYKIGVHPTAEDPSHWNPLVTGQTQEEKVVYGAYYNTGAKDERIARLVVKEGQNVVIDLNGYTIKKASRATHGDWSNVCTDIIGNYGTLKLTDSSVKTGTVKGNGYISCNGAVVHNYDGATCTIEKVNVNGNAAGMSEGTGQYVLANDGGVMIVDSANVYDTATSASLLVSTAGRVMVKGNAVLTHKYSKTVNCKGGEIIIESGVKLVSDEYAVYAKAGTVTVKEGVEIEGTGILYEDGGEIICTTYPVHFKQSTPETTDKLYDALVSGGGINVNKDMELGDDSRFTYGVDLKNKGKINLALNGVLTAGEGVSGGAFGCMKVGAGTKLTVSANDNGRFVNESANSNINIMGGEVVVNGGDFKSAGDCFLFYADQPNGKMYLTINDGNFEAAWRVVSFPGLFDAVITINGGTFKAGADGVIALIWGTGENRATVTIGGGKFYNWDPSAYVDAATHVVTSTVDGADTVYTVTAK